MQQNQDTSTRRLSAATALAALVLPSCTVSSYKTPASSALLADFGSVLSGTAPIAPPAPQPVLDPLSLPDRPDYFSTPDSTLDYAPIDSGPQGLDSHYKLSPSVRECLVHLQLPRVDRGPKPVLESFYPTDIVNYGLARAEWKLSDPNLALREGRRHLARRWVRQQEDEAAAGYHRSLDPIIDRRAELVTFRASNDLFGQKSYTQDTFRVDASVHMPSMSNIKDGDYVPGISFYGRQGSSTTELRFDQQRNEAGGYEYRIELAFSITF